MTYEFDPDFGGMATIGPSREQRPAVSISCDDTGRWWLVDRDFKQIGGPYPDHQSAMDARAAAAPREFNDRAAEMGRSYRR